MRTFTQPLPDDVDYAIKLSMYVGRYCIPTSLGHLDEEDYRMHHLPVLEYDCIGSDRPTEAELVTLSNVETWRRLLSKVCPDHCNARANTHYICLSRFRTLVFRKFRGKWTCRRSLLEPTVEAPTLDELIDMICEHPDLLVGSNFFEVHVEDAPPAVQVEEKWCCGSQDCRHFELCAECVGEDPTGNLMCSNCDAVYAPDGQGGYVATIPTTDGQCCLKAARQ